MKKKSVLWKRSFVTFSKDGNGQLLIRLWFRSYYEQIGNENITIL